MNTHDVLTKFMRSNDDDISFYLVNIYYGVPLKFEIDKTPNEIILLIEEELDNLYGS